MAEGWLCVSTLKQTSYSSSNRTTPALSAKTLTSQSRSRSLGRLEDRLLEQVVDDLALELDPAPERLVRAVLAPGLGQGLELAVGRVAAERGEVVLDGLHLGEAQVELPRLAQVHQRRVVHARGSGPRRGGSR